MTSSERARSRRLLHPVTAAMVLVGAGAFAVIAAIAGQGDLAGVGVPSLLVAGAAAGFANSGST